MCHIPWIFLETSVLTTEFVAHMEANRHSLTMHIASFLNHGVLV